VSAGDVFTKQFLITIQADEIPAIERSRNGMVAGQQTAGERFADATLAYML